jgi:hypothetical protein
MRSFLRTDQVPTLAPPSSAKRAGHRLPQKNKAIEQRVATLPTPTTLIAKSQKWNRSNRGRMLGLSDFR